MAGRMRGIALGVVLGVIFLVLLLWMDNEMLSPLPEGLSTYANEIDTTFFIIYYITGAAFVLVTVLLVLFLIQGWNRRRQGHPAIYSHGSNVLEFVWTIIPAIVFIILFLISQGTWAKIKYQDIAPRGDVEVRVTAKQFNWEFQYPGPDGKFDTGDDKTIDGDLHVPVNKKVRVYLRAKDVIHSFFVPVLRLKQDAVPGREIIAWFEAIKAGRWEIPCAELCGPGHSGMKGWLKVDTDEEYAEWVQEQWPSS